MIASFFELDHSRTVEASLPAFLLCNLNKDLRRGILGTLSRRVHLVIADTAHPGPTSFTLSYFATVLEADVIGFDPLATMTSRAVDTVSSGVLLEFPIPGLLEFLVEELVNMLERDVLSGATFRGHVGRIRDGHCEDATKTNVAHSMLTYKLGRLDHWYIIRATSEAGHFFQTHLRGWRTS